MSQKEVLAYLKEQRKKSAKWHTSKEIREGLKLKEDTTNNRKLWSDLYALAAFNLIKVKGVGLIDHKKVFRYN